MKPVETEEKKKAGTTLGADSTESRLKGRKPLESTTCPETGLPIPWYLADKPDHLARYQEGIRRSFTLPRIPPQTPIVSKIEFRRMDRKLHQRADNLEGLKRPSTAT